VFDVCRDRYHLLEGLQVGVNVAENEISHHAPSQSAI
jgi:hypothetical protein